MDTAQLKYSIIEKLIRTEDEQLLEKIAKLMRSSPVTYPENNLKPMSVEELEERLREAEEDIKAGRLHTSEEMRAYFKIKGRGTWPEHSALKT